MSEPLEQSSAASAPEVGPLQTVPAELDPTPSSQIGASSEPHPGAVQSTGQTSRASLRPATIRPRAHARPIPQAPAAPAANLPLVGDGVAKRLENWVSSERATVHRDVLNEARSFDGRFDRWINGIAPWFTAQRVQRIREFFGPSLAGAVGTGLFAFFDLLGAGSARDGSSVQRLIKETAASLSSPYLLLAAFLLSTGLVIGGSAGKNPFTRWVVAPFLSVAQQGAMLGLGVFGTLSIHELAARPSWHLLIEIYIVAKILIAEAFVFSKGKAYFEGRYRIFFENLGRRVQARLVGLILALVAIAGLGHYANEQKDTPDRETAHALGR